MTHVWLGWIARVAVAMAVVALMAFAAAQHQSVAAKTSVPAKGLTSGSL